MEPDKLPPSLGGDLAAMGVNPILAGAAVVAVVITLVAYVLLKVPGGSARLTYFEGHGRAEEIRLMLALCGVKWRNQVCLDPNAEYVTTEKQMRALMSAGVLGMDQLPLLEIDGLHLVQQNAILRYLARRHNLYGRSAAEAAQIDILSDSITDWAPLTALMQGSKDAGHAKYLSRFQRVLDSNDSESGFLVGRSPSFADVQLFQALACLAETKAVDLKAKYPRLEAYRARVAKLPGICEYLASGQRSKFPGPGSKEEFIAGVSKVIPWVFGKAEQPPLLSSTWRFQA